MPKKQKKSQAAKQRWKKFHEFHSVPTCEQAECDFPQCSAEDSVSAKTNADSVKQAGQHVPAHVQQVSYADAVKSGLQHEFNEQHEVSSAPQVGYADFVKRGRHSDVAGPSHAERVKLENQPSVTHVCASHSQAHPKYGDSRNKQCTCNSLTFLAFLHENENMTTADLNLVLDKGDVMYKEAKKRFPKNIHLATDELPDKVDARRSMYHVDMTQPSRYGTFEEPPEEAVDTFLSLEAGLSCLLSDVQYALLIMSGLCIAVFRSTSGKYGFFDPHSRTPSGFPLALLSRNRGTAVMLKFTLLSDMIKRLQDSYQMMEISPSCNYELKPVQFYSMSTVNLSDTITDTVCRPTAATAVAPTHSDKTVDEANSSTPRRNTTTDLTENIFCQMSICTPPYKDVSIRDDPELCDPTLPDEDDEDDDDENMNEDDYDEADLMEIDSCEKNALSEAQNKNEQDIDMLSCDAAEMRWPEVIEAITRQQGEQVNFEGLDWSAKCDILRSNPVTTMRMFDKRVEALFRDLLLSPAEPLGKVIDYFYRVEFQHRGSPHIHCLLWVEGAPVFEEDDDQTVVDFINKYITAQLPDPHKQPELYKKVTEVQKHSKNHTKTCFRSLSSGCRFGFPKSPCNETMITRPSEDDELEVETAKNKLRPLNQLLNEPETASMSLEQLLARCKLTHAEYERYLNKRNTRSTIILKRDPKDSWINGYNPHLLEAWNSNIDISFVLDAFGAANYLMKYISKKEGGLSEYLKTVTENSHKDSVNECDEMRAVMQAYSKKREISAQECVARVCGLHMKQCSRAVIFIPTDDNPVKMSRPLSVLDNTTPESSNVWMTSLNDKYKARPETPEYEEMCMADFAATCRIVYGQQTKGKDVLPLLNEMGFVQRRKNDKPAFIRFHRCSQEKHPEQYYGRLLKLYLPHRSDHELKTPTLPTYQAFYGAGCVQLPGTDRLEYVQHIVKRNREKYEKNSEEIESAVEEYEQNRGVTDE
ncbi:ATP-dependent DNA helicase PIF1 [Sarotherodon galilaeus]